MNWLKCSCVSVNGHTHPPPACWTVYPAPGLLYYTNTAELQTLQKHLVFGADVANNRTLKLGKK